jgi:hypothetical protein
MIDIINDPHPGVATVDEVMMQVATRWEVVVYPAG